MEYLNNGDTLFLGSGAIIPYQDNKSIEPSYKLPPIPPIDFREDSSDTLSYRFNPANLQRSLSLAQRHSPPTGRISGASSRTLAMMYDKCKIVVEAYSPSLEEVIKLDQFFDMYGYATNSVKIPNEDSRESWNYVKTRNVVIFGTMPVEAMACIKAMYNRGVRFWHTVDVGNYSLSNRDMKEVK